jgi:RNA polymerase sigma-70 factor (ECF subfamily)
MTDQVAPDAAGEPCTASFETFYRDELPGLLRFLVHSGASVVDACDAGQHAFVETYSRWDRVRKMDAPEAYLRTCAVNELRRLVTRPRTDRERAIRGGWLDQTAIEDLDHEQEVNAVLLALAALPARQRQVMAWHYDGYRPREIARLMEMRPETVRTTLRDARAALGARLRLAAEEARDE